MKNDENSMKNEEKATRKRRRTALDEKIVFVVVMVVVDGGGVVGLGGGLQEAMEALAPGPHGLELAPRAPFAVDVGRALKLHQEQLRVACRQ